MSGAEPSNDTLAALFEILKSFNKTGAELKPETRFSEDLNFDSLVVMEFIAVVEDAFDISVPLNILPDIATIRDLARAVEKVLEDRALASDLTAAATAVVRKCDWKEVRKPLYEGYGFLSEQIQQHAIGAAVTMPVISGSVSAQGGDA